MGAGADLIVDLAGRDLVLGGDGDDRITVRDLAGEDRVRCGGGADLVIVDSGDDVRTPAKLLRPSRLGFGYDGLPEARAQDRRRARALSHRVSGSDYSYSSWRRHQV